MESVQRMRASLGGVERLRLVLSYQRYAFVVLAIIAGLLVSAWSLNTMGTWIVAGGLSLFLTWFGTLVALRLPHKLRLTRTQDERIRRGRFDPDDLLSWVEDPCYRVVAREILVRAGRSRSEARAEVAELARKAAQHEGIVIYRRPSPSGGANEPPAPGSDVDSRALEQEETR